MKFSLLVTAFFIAAGAALPAQDLKLAEAIAQARKAYAAEKYEEADRAFDSVASLAVDNFEAMLLRAQICYAWGESGMAVTFSDNALKLEPKNMEAIALNGKSLFAAGEAARSDGQSSKARVIGFYDNSAEAFGKAVAMKPDDAELWNWKGHAHFWATALDASAAAFEKAASLEPAFAGHWFGLARTRESQANELSREAAETKSPQKLDAATDAKTKAVEAAKSGLTAKDLHPDVAAELANLVSRRFFPERRADEAFVIYKAWGDAHKEDSTPLGWQGYCKATLGKDDEAIALYLRAFEMSKKMDASAAFELGMAHFRKGDMEKSAEWHKAAMTARPGGWHAENGPVGQILASGNSYAIRGDFAKAVSLVEKYALPHGANNWRVFNNLGMWHRDWADRLGRKGSEARAKNEIGLKHYEKAVELVLKDENASNNWKARLINDIGVMYDYQFGDMEKGIKEYRRALEFDPTWIDALENLGACMNKLGKHEEAAALFRKCVAQDPNRRVSRNGLAEAERKLGK